MFTYPGCNLVPSSLEPLVLIINKIIEGLPKPGPNEWIPVPDWQFVALNFQFVRLMDYFEGAHCEYSKAEKEKSLNILKIWWHLLRDCPTDYLLIDCPTDDEASCPTDDEAQEDDETSAIQLISPLWLTKANEVLLAIEENTQFYARCKIAIQTRNWDFFKDIAPQYIWESYKILDAICKQDIHLIYFLHQLVNSPQQQLLNYKMLDAICMQDIHLIYSLHQLVNVPQQQLLNYKMLSHALKYQSWDLLREYLAGGVTALHTLHPEEINDQYRNWLITGTYSTKKDSSPPPDDLAITLATLAYDAGFFAPKNRIQLKSGQETVEEILAKKYPKYQGSNPHPLNSVHALLYECQNKFAAEFNTSVLFGMEKLCTNRDALVNKETAFPMLLDLIKIIGLRRWGMGYVIANQRTPKFGMFKREGVMLHVNNTTYGDYLGRFYPRMRLTLDGNNSILLTEFYSDHVWNPAPFPPETLTHSPVMQEILTRFHNALLWDPLSDTKEKLHCLLASFEWLWYNATPFSRGSAATGKMLSDIIMCFHNLSPIPSPSVGSIDLEALCSPYPVFEEWYLGRLNPGVDYILNRTDHLLKTKELYAQLVSKKEHVYSKYAYQGFLSQFNELKTSLESLPIATSEAGLTFLLRMYSLIIDTEIKEIDTLHKLSSSV